MNSRKKSLDFVELVFSRTSLTRSWVGFEPKVFQVDISIRLYKLMAIAQLCTNFRVPKNDNLDNNFRRFGHQNLRLSTNS
jgi:hypothetical protein